MHAKDLTLIAGRIATRCVRLIHTTPPKSPDYLELYWSASHQRQQRWSEFLLQSTSTVSAEMANGRLSADKIHAHLVEIMTGELLCRLSSAIAGARAPMIPADEWTICHSIFAGQQRVTNLMWRWMHDIEPLVPGLIHGMLQFWGTCERWNDLLLGYVQPLYNCRHLAFDPRKLAEFSVELQHRYPISGGRRDPQPILENLARSFSSRGCLTSPHLDLNAQIGGALLGFVLIDDRFFLPAAKAYPWHICFSDVTDHTQALIRSLQ